MPLIQWSQALSVKVGIFDGQHQKLVSIINDLYDAMKQGKGKDVLDKVFADLIDYTKIHFKAEEDLMQKFGYPDMAVHTKAHNDLTRQALDLQAKFKTGQMFVSIDTLNFLKDWLSVHIQSMDKQYGDFFNSKGIR